VVDGDERNEQEEEPLHNLSDPDAARAEESFAEKFHHILLGGHNLRFCIL
jgi:hypothetical protein